MIWTIALLALLFQAQPAQQSATQLQRATVAGVVLNGVTGSPLPSVRVTLARTDLPVGPFAQFMTSADRRPPIELNLPPEMLAVMFEVRDGDPEAASRAAAMKALPLAEIHELILGTSGSVGIVSKSSPPALTDSGGRFAFNNVEPGRYRLIFDSDGFSKRDYGQRTESGEGVQIVLAGGEVKSDLVMRLMPVASVNGRLRDTAGQPAVGVSVDLFRMEFDETGKKTPKVVASAQSDDRGEYRMFFLSPGRYYLSAGHLAGSTRPEDEPGGLPGLDGLLLGRGYVTPNRIPQKYSLTYYPGTANLSSAIALDVHAGSDLRSIDMVVDEQKPYRVRGRVVDQGSGRPPQEVGLSLIVETDNSALMIAGFGLAANGRYEPTDGTFEIRDVSPGTYSLTATVLDAASPEPPGFPALSPAERRRARPRAFARINITNSDVEGIVLTVGTGHSIAGRFQVEAVPTSIPANLQLLGIWLSSPMLSSVNGFDTMIQPTAVDGSFRMNNLLPGEYRLSVFGLPAGFYVKHARLGDTDVLNSQLRISGPSSDTLDILISPAVASVDGSARDVAGQPAAGATVVLIPQNRERKNLFMSVSSDSTGGFMFQSVTPGDYVLAAWDVLEPFAFFDPDLIRQAERQGTTLRVAESSKQSVTVTSIPITVP